MGLLVLLNDHKGEDDVARLADDLDLEIDEILPSLEFAQVLQLVSVADGRVGLTDVGRRLLNGTIRERKIVLRDQLRRRCSGPSCRRSSRRRASGSPTRR